jgi:hypothetical protein
VIRGFLFVCFVSDPSLVVEVWRFVCGERFVVFESVIFLRPQSCETAELGKFWWTFVAWLLQNCSCAEVDFGGKFWWQVLVKALLGFCDSKFDWGRMRT